MRCDTSGILKTYCLLPLIQKPVFVKYKNPQDPYGICVNVCKSVFAVNKLQITTFTLSRARIYGTSK